jgi:hypothetical protein
MQIIKPFIAGFLATLTFHQAALWLLYTNGIAPSAPYSLDPTKPFGVPSVISLAFWGGLWGILMLYTLRPILKRPGFWITAIVFGAIVPTLVAWFVVAPLKDQPIAGGWKMPAMLIGPVINGAWGLGTAVFLKLFRTR